jgi:hypothetical protein
MPFRARPRNAWSPSTGSWITSSLLAATVLLAGCSSGPATDGPLSDKGTPGEECTPAPRGGVLSYGFEAMTNTGQADVIVKDVRLADPRGLRIVAAYFVPITGTHLYGVRSGFPPAAHLDPGVLWPQRQRATGAHLPHTSAGHFINLLVVIRPADSGGTATGMVVDYTASGQQYRLTTPTALQVVVNSQCPQ